MMHDDDEVVQTSNLAFCSQSDKPLSPLTFLFVSLQLLERQALTLLKITSLSLSLSPALSSASAYLKFGFWGVLPNYSVCTCGTTRVTALMDL